MFQCLDVLLCFWLPNCACRGSLLWSRRRTFDLPPVLVVQAGPSVQQIRDLVKPSKPSKPSTSTTSKGKAFAFRLKPEGNASMDLDWRDWRKRSMDHCNLWAIFGLQSVLECLEAFSAMEFFFCFDVHAVGFHICSGCDSVTVDTMFARRQYVPPVLDTAQVHLFQFLRFFTLVSTCQQHHLLGRQTRWLGTEACQDFILAMKCRSAKDRERKKNVEAPFD